MGIKTFWKTLPELKTQALPQVPRVIDDSTGTPVDVHVSIDLPLLIFRGAIPNNYSDSLQAYIIHAAVGTVHQSLLSLIGGEELAAVRDDVKLVKFYVDGDAPSRKAFTQQQRLQSASNAPMAIYPRKEVMLGFLDQHHLSVADVDTACLAMPPFAADTSFDPPSSSSSSSLSPPLPMTTMDIVTREEQTPLPSTSGGDGGSSGNSDDTDNVPSSVVARTHPFEPVSTEEEEEDAEPAEYSFLTQLRNIFPNLVACELCSAGESEFAMFHGRDRKVVNVLLTADTDIFPITYRYEQAGVTDLVYVYNVCSQMNYRSTSTAPGTVDDYDGSGGVDATTFKSQNRIYDMTSVNLWQLSRLGFQIFCTLLGTDFTPNVLSQSMARQVIQRLDDFEQRFYAHYKLATETPCATSMPYVKTTRWQNIGSYDKILQLLTSAAVDTATRDLCIASGLYKRDILVPARVDGDGSSSSNNSGDGDIQTRAIVTTALVYASLLVALDPASTMRPKRLMTTCIQEGQPCPYLDEVRWCVQYFDLGVDDVEQFPKPTTVNLMVHSPAWWLYRRALEAFTNAPAESLQKVVSKPSLAEFWRNHVAPHFVIYEM